MLKQLWKLEPLRKLILSVMAIGMFAFSLNIPTPVVIQKDAEVAFPCQNCPCGCENAQQCWDSCCCFSDTEKLLWARTNKVTPPDWFLERIADQSLLASLKRTTTAAEPKKVVCCCHCSSSKPTAVTINESPANLPCKTIAVRTTIQQLLGCQGKQELLKKQIVFLLVDAHQPAAHPYWRNLPIISESSSNLAVAPPIPPS